MINADAFNFLQFSTMWQVPNLTDMYQPSAEMFVIYKRSSLLCQHMSCWNRKFYSRDFWLQFPIVRFSQSCAIKHFTVVINSVKQHARVFLSTSHFHSTLIFASKVMILSISREKFHKGQVPAVPTNNSLGWLETNTLVYYSK